MNKTIRRTAVFCLVLVFALLVRVTWVQSVDSQALASNQYNQRPKIAQFAQPLGNIIVAGKPITGSVKTSGTSYVYKRTYTNGPLYSAVTGFSSQVYGTNLLEGVYEKVLNGTDSRLQSVQSTITGTVPKPGNAITTIDPAVQQAAYAGLGNKEGAAVAIDPVTGRILAAVSTPSFDPGTFSGSTYAEGSVWNSLVNSPSQPMLNRALRQTYPPGSTFKLIVAASALENGLYTSITQPTNSPNPYNPPGTSVPVTNELASMPCLNASIEVALQYSCNTVFGKMAVDLGQAKVRATAEKFGFNSNNLYVPVHVAQSNYPPGMNVPQTALSGFGQFNDTATPLQMAMIVSAISNGGKLATPHMVSKVTDSSGNVLQSFPDGQTKQVISASTAQALQTSMVTVVQAGTGTNAQIPGIMVGGKTGTAQNGVNNAGAPFAWFVSFAKSGNKQIAVAVVVLQSNAARAEISGNGLAGPIAKSMMMAGLGL
jgi:cell division protein FtsI/penicillin-binding protein 2